MKRCFLALALILISCTDDLKPIDRPTLEDLSSSSAKSGSSSSDAPEEPATCGGEEYDTSKLLCDARDNKLYKYVPIGEQIWMAENLNYKAEGSKCYGDLETNCDTYGRLYDWETAKEACPDGWHLPTKVEFIVLLDFVGGSSIAGRHLKAEKNEGAASSDDAYGFTALLGGFCNPNNINVCSQIKTNGYWWSASKNGENDDADYQGMVNTSNNAATYPSKISNLYSVRCLRD